MRIANTVADIFFFQSFPLSNRTSMCALVASLYQRHILLLQDSMLPKQTVGPLKSSVLRSMLQLRRMQYWMPAVLESQVNLSERSPCSESFSEASPIKGAILNEKDGVIAKV